jgi:hypothetical protein
MDWHDNRILTTSSGIVVPILIGMLTGGCRSPQPSIQFTKVPAAGEGSPDKLEVIEGRVTGAKPGAHVVLYAKSGVWWIQPLKDSPFTTIQPALTRRNSTHPGAEYAALLLDPKSENGYAAPSTTQRLPHTGGAVIAVATAKGTGSPVVSQIASVPLPSSLEHVHVETSLKDSNKENFCGYGTGLQCLVFTWRFGAGMTALPTLGGTNASFGAINNLGEVSGYAETSHKDPACPGKVAVNGTGPQLFDFEPVIWGPRPGQIRQLSLLPGDTVAMALGINDYGQAVGTSGTCANTIVPGFGAGPHAVLWQRDGSVADLGNLGGTVNTGILAAGTVAWTINNRGMLAGQSDLPGDKAFHPFLWTRETGMMDLGVLPGDLVG